MILGDIAVLHTADDWLAIVKPAGASMHNEDGEGFIAALSQRWQQPLWPLHRLDKVTSGILLLGTSADAARRFGHLFEQHQIEKYYLAQSQHKPKKKQGWIKGDMVKTRNGSWKLSRSLDNPAVTRFISHYDAEQQRRLFLLQPHTGRTHQLRVAMKSLAAPIDGDQRYGGDVAERTFLHAMAMRFVDRGEEVCLFNKPEGNHWGHLPPTWQAPWQCF